MSDKKPLVAHAYPVDAYPVGVAAIPATPVPVTPGICISPETAANIDGFLDSTEGLLLRERLWLSQVLCGVCEKKTQFKVGRWSRDMPDRLHDSDFMAQPAALEIKEESGCCCRYCCHQWRTLQLGVFRPMDLSGSMGYGSGWPSDQTPLLLLDRPFKCPLVCCCFMPWPPEMHIYRPPATGRRRYEAPIPPEVLQRDFTQIGRAVMDWKWWNCCWPCYTYIDVHDASGMKVFTLEQPRCFGGGCVNCCAPSCFNYKHHAPIWSAAEGPAAGAVENHWPGCNFRGCCLANSAADNFVLRFPDRADSTHKALLLGAWALSNFVYWEQRGNQKN